MNEINIFLAFGAGVLSFISPCNLPLYPVFISYITGVSIEDLKEKGRKISPIAMLHTFIFILGFSTIFVALGMSTSLIGEFFIMYNQLIRQIGAIVIVIFGLITLGLFKPSFLMKNHQLQLSKKPVGFFGTYFIGIAFAAGWTPCIGPILTAVITLSLTNPGSGMTYMSAYSVGFALPFFFMTFFIGKLNWIKKYMNLMMKIGGILMILFGIMLYFDWMTKVTSFLINNLFGGFMGF
ncbi:cytochrome C biogenesis protein [Alkalihalobacillus alcalophilus ATCC 27647 = CGMCC 1.3604]|uniref:Cytochrome C biogenesis protein n=1 Tax=Alkalihalobacillus alcalophilus ATCC 27647 = CGMCC 1.3604 TaxID=1218173 RepID=A0A094WL38_ALKAL|nr:cytochrome c biogenesis protein CcdA [Alkalihalobacillus alcalophilus]KGA96653.1 cytochrome C biogenesis protein CcdA [Alkalihalobacillus alcalophilus ATCC 27647 = CGMCC 1.3604]MED1561837.1 cytochrome c biogenesis protein CcdA [Alkalihalobacillus alcalophilus]THG91001.1 cytochrome C biogenesis protein [Alkalihalobacillus alcalophilus ATCC 27647 = CGMCC 1.3604]